jgi:hypothetical protein
MAHTKATREKIRKARLGKHHSPETREKIRQALLERGALVKAGFLPAFHHSEKTKRLLRRKAKGRKPSKKAIAASVAARQVKALDRKVGNIAHNSKFN